MVRPVCPRLLSASVTGFTVLNPLPPPLTCRWTCRRPLCAAEAVNQWDFGFGRAASKDLHMGREENLGRSASTHPSEPHIPPQLVRHSPVRRGGVDDGLALQQHAGQLTQK